LLLVLISSYRLDRYGRGLCGIRMRSELLDLNCQCQKSRLVENQEFSNSPSPSLGPSLGFGFGYEEARARTEGKEFLPSELLRLILSVPVVHKRSSGEWTLLHACTKIGAEAKFFSTFDVEKTAGPRVRVRVKLSNC
jgi:hypothetical protein